MDSLKVRSSELLDKKQKLSQINEEIKLKSNSTKFRTVECFSIKRKLIMATLTDFFTANVCQPWTNYVNNGNKYLIIGAVVNSEYSNI